MSNRHPLGCKCRGDACAMSAPPHNRCSVDQYDHWNSPVVLPPVGCPIVLRIGCAVVQAERTAHIERRDREMTYQLPGGQVLTGRYFWSYP